jgi:large subunit ribosomal protein L23
MSAVIKHNEERLMKVLLSPVISEKATFVAEKNEQVVFLVTPDATKPEIKAAVEMMFSTKEKKIEVVDPDNGKTKLNIVRVIDAYTVLRLSIPRALPAHREK